MLNIQSTAKLDGDTWYMFVCLCAHYAQNSLLDQLTRITISFMAGKPLFSVTETQPEKCYLVEGEA